MMKKMWTIFLLVVLLSVSVTGFAAGHRRHFVDTNHDGKCDYVHTSCKFIDKDKDGRCDTCGTKAGKKRHRKGYVDKNKDGKCDSCGVKVCKKSKTGYTGKNKNGICGRGKTSSGYRNGHCGRGSRGGCHR